MSKFRIVQREGLYYVQRRICLIWFYETEVNFAHKNFLYQFDAHGMIGFVTLEDSKRYLDKFINSRTKIIYEVDA